MIDTLNSFNLKTLMSENEILSITEAARFIDRTRQAVVVAIDKRLLKATFMKRHPEANGARWFVEKKDLTEYFQNRYSRLKCKDIHGNLIYDPSKGIYSPPMFANFLGLPSQRVYYLMRTGAIPFHKKGIERENGIVYHILIYAKEIKNLDFLMGKRDEQNKVMDLK